MYEDTFAVNNIFTFFSCERQQVLLDTASVYKLGDLVGF